MQKDKRNIFVMTWANFRPTFILTGKKESMQKARTAWILFMCTCLSRFLSDVIKTPWAAVNKGVYH